MIKTDHQSRRILVSGEIDEDFGLQFTDSLLELQVVSNPIDIVFIASEGGNWEVAKACLSLMLNSNCHITTYCLGNNYSSSAMLVMGGDERYIDPLGSLMFHFGSIGLGEEEIKDLSDYAKSSKKDMDWDCKFLSARSNRPPSYYMQKMLDRDLIIDAEKAAELELVHYIGLPQ